MKKTLLIIFIISLLSCKNKTEDYIHKQSKDATIGTKNQYKYGGITDTIASNIFDDASEQASKGDFEKAKKLYFKALTIEPNNVLINNAIGGIYADLDKKTNSIKYFKKSLNIDSTYNITYLNFGKSYNQLREFDESIAVLMKGLEYVDSKNIERKSYFYYNLANSYYKKKDYTKARIYNDKALNLVTNKAVKKDVLELSDVLATYENN